MVRKLVIVGLVAILGFYAASRLNLFSYAQTLWSQVHEETKSSVPIGFEIKRLRGEIARMDDDIEGQLKPIAKHMAAVSRLEKDIHARKDTLADKKIVIMKMLDDLKDDPQFVSYDGTKYPATDIRSKLNRDFEAYKRSDIDLKSQVKLLAAKKRTLESARNQLHKLITKKREFVVQLAQLEAQAESLSVEAMATNLKVDSTRATKISEDLRALEDRLAVKKAEIELTQGPLFGDIPVMSGPDPQTDVDEIRNYFQTPQPTTTANNKR